MLQRADARGANFGWPEYEGNQLFNPGLPGQDPVTFPIHTYSHAGGACAITGGFVVRDPELTELAGRYLYGDFCTGQLRSFRPDLSTGQALGDAPVGVVAPQLSSFGEGVGGQIYVVMLSGPVYRLEPALGLDDPADRDGVERDHRRTTIPGSWDLAHEFRGTLTTSPPQDAKCGMRYSINIPKFGDFADADTVARVAAAAEAAGWDGLFVWDHVVHHKRDRPGASAIPGCSSLPRPSRRPGSSSARW